MSETYETFQEFSDRYWNQVRSTPEFQWRMADFRWTNFIYGAEPRRAAGCPTRQSESPVGQAEKSNGRPSGNKLVKLASAEMPTAPSQACSAHAAPQGERGADTPSQPRPSPRHLTAWQRTCRREWERLKGEANGLRR
jgi:hypothetical protein